MKEEIEGVQTQDVQTSPQVFRQWESSYAFYRPITNNKTYPTSLFHNSI